MSRTVVVALGGNALLRRGEPLEAENQARAARDAARRLGLASEDNRLVITHGNGPQVGLLALMSESYSEVSATGAARQATPPTSTSAAAERSRHGR